MPTRTWKPLCVLAATCVPSASARDLSQINPPFPRIGTCYGAGLSWQTWEKGAEYWAKVDLFMGGCYDLHYDWENERWPKALARVEENVRRLREVNPHVAVLPYVDVIEGPDNPNVPKHWWALNDKGERWSGWPGMFRINTDLPEVLQFNLDKVRQEVLGRECFDGVFYDCWGPDKWLVPETAKLRDGKAVVMINTWNLPSAGFESLNGTLAEDEVNRVMEGKVDFEDFLSRYLRWTRESRKPVTTTLVCHPRTIDDDPWRWAKLTHEQRVAAQEKARADDEQTMRFGLATTLMGDGYFGYDCGTMGRGNWWWYKEYDAPLGYPKGAARRNADGTWQRDYDGGTVVVNGTLYDAVVQLPAKCRDVSTGRVGTRFTVPMFDGRIFLPTDDPATPEDDLAPRLTATPPAKLRLVKLEGGFVAVQTPGGLDLRFDPNGALRQLLWRGRSVMTGGFPIVASPPFTQFHVENVTADQSATDTEARLTFRGSLVESAQRAEFVETCTVRPDNRFTLRFDFTATTALDLRLWRHYFAFPVTRYAGATARADGKEIALPATLKDEQLLPASKHLVVEAKDVAISLDSSLPLGLVDHRKWGTDEYLLAGYPVSGAVKQGARWTVETTILVGG
jgi:hypothetical protein